MNVAWILYKKNHGYKKSSYAVKRLLEASAPLNLNLEIIDPLDFSLDLLEKSKPSWVITRTGAYTSDYDLKVVEQIEKSSTKILNGSKGLNQARNKFMAYEVLSSHHIPQPKTFLLPSLKSLEFVSANLTWPFIFKPVSGAQGKNVFLCETKENFLELCQTFQLEIANNEYIVQEFIKSSHGRDLRVLVLGNEVIACVERISKTGDFKANVSQGAEVKPYVMTEEIKRLAIAVTQASQLEFTGIDLLFSDDGFVFCEANSAPGFEGIEKSLGIDIASKILIYMQSISS